MTEFLSMLGGVLVKAGILALIANEIRGFILAAPVIYAMYLSGGTAMALWLGFCSLAGILLSVTVPYFLARRFKLIPVRAAR